MQDQSNGSPNLMDSITALLKDDKRIKVGAHNMNKLQLEDLKQKRMMGEVEMIEANMSEDHQIPAAEAHMLHAMIENVEYDSKSGVKKSTAIRQVFYPLDFDKMSRTTPVRNSDGSYMPAENAFSGYSVKVIHDPRKTSSAKSVKLSDMSTSDLREAYLSVFGDNPSEDLEREEIILLIEEKLGKPSRTNNGKSDSPASKAPSPAPKKQDASKPSPKPSPKPSKEDKQPDADSNTVQSAQADSADSNSDVNPLDL